MTRPQHKSNAGKTVCLLAPPADERDAWRLIVDAIATEIVPPGALVDALRPVLARLAREVDFDDPAYAAELLDAARTLERADARRTWACTKPLRRRVFEIREHFGDPWCEASFERVVLSSMLDAWRSFHGA